MQNLNEIEVKQVKGVGPKSLERLQELKIYTVADLLNHFPRSYDDFEVIDINHAEDGEKVTVIGDIVTEPVFQYYKGKRNRKMTRLTFKIRTNQAIIKVIAFNRAFLRGKINQGQEITVTGKFDRQFASITANELKLDRLENASVRPQYTLKSLPYITFTSIIKNALDEFGELANDELPTYLLERYRLISKKRLYSFAHTPKNREQIKQVFRRVKYEELLLYQLKIFYLKQVEYKREERYKKVFDQIKANEFINNLPFELTKDQMNAINDILGDLSKEQAMNRLLQGDVGSGKTVVAALSLYANYLAGYQGTLMAPTEILAEQHAKTLNDLFISYHLKIELLTSSVSKKQRSLILTRLKNHEIDILIGTHSLISEGVTFKRLGLGIVDEQHRFGVMQRKLLKDKGDSVDALFLSATPIPRTLALSTFGDMEISSIKQLPKGRKPVQTHLINSKYEERLLGFVRKIISLGQQVYVIAPLIEESDKIDIQNAVDIYEKYQTIFGERINIGLLHGKMKQEEKETIMGAFKNNTIQLLVSTTVVEVGVNVPNASLMVIVDADRFGLAQLHQLRGRVGRGEHQSYCILVCDHQSEKTLERLTVMTNTTNGFELAEHDLKLRGPGDFFGAKQSGLPEFKMADLVKDYKILEIAREDAKAIIESNEIHQNKDYLPLRLKLFKEIDEMGNRLD
ncbi:ATP-dependent DNA helicase RecG [Haloplasma contractile]|uniref:ATP-dependent DNA helicase RecG n=1 Tax=Haloplasma contractile SSD-17B TaxID=1033810 RepID=U2FR08_9MOLU|nr:ATP-dependent DNA helicase RecG [Haloplasma contractile]ERJ13434.1 ATP-dependent DNA helicase RecG protein [Haloplasma contractile SSD-17B]